MNIQHLRSSLNIQTISHVAGNAAVLSVWLWLFHPVYPYLRIIFTRQEFRTNQVVLLAVLALVIFQVRKGDFRPRLDALPQLYPPALALALGGGLLFLYSERYLAINTFSATLFGLASYGLCGLWLRREHWRSGLPASLLLVGALPFGEHLDTFVGYPLRIATARAVSQGLAGLGVPNLGVDTILIFENGISQVDSPCSGVKSLWTGGLFLLAASWVEHRALNRRWLLASLAFGVLLVGANLGRVAVLVLVGQAAGWQLLAQMLHVPLGVIGFTMACGAALVMLRWAGSLPPQDPENAEETLSSPSRPTWLAPFLVLALLGMVVLYTPRPRPANAAAPAAWVFPDPIEASEWPLTPGELNWLSAEGTPGSISASRWRFTSGALRGSFLFVTSRTWRAQHRPERCFTVYGLEVQESLPLMAAADFPLRWLSLGTHSDPAIYSAAYWLQSADQITEDYAVRIWDDLAPQPQPWTLVTVLFDAPTDYQQESVMELLGVLRTAVQDNLEPSG